MRKHLATAIVSSLLLVRAAAAATAVPTEHGAWTRWAYPDDNGTATPRFFSLLAARFGEPAPPVDQLPFRYSVAVLVGVQHYDDPSVTPFQFVNDDIERLRLYLLGDGGFDVVYVLLPEAASPTAVEMLIKNELSQNLDSRDRLLFYFSGHGTNAGASTGYMAFPKVKPGDWVTDLLPVIAIREWSGMLPARHALFVLDSCSAGFGLSEKDVSLGSAQAIVEALKGHGSRLLLTAGADAQRALEVTDGKEKGGSLFTAEFLEAIAGGASTPGPFDVVLTTDEIYAFVRKETTIKAGLLGGALTPHIEPIKALLYDGVFLFLNPRSQGKNVDAALASQLGFPGAGKAPAIPTPANVEIVVGLGAQHRRGRSLTLDAGLIGGAVSYKLTLELNAPSPVPLQLDVEGAGLDASFTGGAWSTTAEPGKLVELDVALRPERITTAPRLEIRSGQLLLADILVNSRLVEPEITREVHSGPKDSGELKSFSSLYRLCLGPPPAGYAWIPGSDEFSLSGDRRCGAWSTCEPAQRDASDVCWGFTLQGHDELIFDRGVRQSEGHLRGRYRLRQSEPELRVGA